MRIACRVRLTLCLVIVMVSGTSVECCWGRVFSPRVVTPRLADTYSAVTFAKHPAWKDLAPDARAKAMFEYLTDPETGLYPLGAGVFEGGDRAYEFGLVRDPMKVINVYGYGYCDVFGPVMAGVWQQGGNGPARVIDMPGLSHVACEVMAADRWRYLDVDLRGSFIGTDGSLRSLEEARQDPSLWQREHGPRFFPMDDLQKLSQQFSQSKIEHRYGVAPSGHTLDFVLRRGERFQRWWQPQGGRWLVSPDDAKDPARRQLLEQEPRGPKSKHATFTRHSHGNGQFVYRPNLKKDAADFDDGVFDSQNVRITDDGLTLEKPGDGWAVFEVRSPYVIVPLVGKIEDPKDDKDASVVEIDASDASLAWSPDFGDTWITLETKQWPTTIDMTPHVAGSYGYLLKIGLKGKPGSALLKSLKITTWVQTAPATLPSLQAGENPLELKTGDQFGRPTRVLAIQPNATDENAFLHYLLRAPQEYDPTSRAARARGTMIARLPSLPRTKIDWFSVGASFGMPVGSDAKPPKNAIEYAINTPREFTPVFGDGDGGVNVIARPTPQAHWHYNFDTQVGLSPGAGDVVYVRYTGFPLNAYRMFAHCLDDRPRAASPLTVTHHWTEAGQPKQHSQVLEPGMTRYQVQTGADVANVAIELSVPGSPD